MINGLAKVHCFGWRRRAEPSRMVVYKVISKTSRRTWASLREAAWTRICTSNKYTKSHRNFLLASCILGAFLAEVSCIRFFIVVCSFVMPSNCSNRFRMATRIWCNSSCFCGPLVAKGEETDLSWHGDYSPPSDNSSSRILFSAGGPAVLARGQQRHGFVSVSWSQGKEICA